MSEVLVVLKRASDNAVLARELRGGRIPTDAEFQAAAASRLGGVASDYVIVRSTNDAIKERVMRGDEFALNNANAFDFSADNAKRFLLASTNKTEVLDDGVDFALITLTARNTNAQGGIGAVASGVNATIRVTIEAPWGLVKVPVTFVNGVATKRLRRRAARDEGVWRIPANVPNALYKVRPVGVVEVEIMSVLEDDV